MLVALVIVLAVGPKRILSATDAIPVIAAQSVLLLIAIDLVFNLLPLPAAHDDDGALNDGLGLLLSPFVPRSHFVRLLTLPWRMQTRSASNPLDRISAYEEGLRHHPQNPFLHVLLADAHKEARRIHDARDHLLRALQSPDLPKQWVEELCRRVGAG